MRIFLAWLGTTAFGFTVGTGLGGVVGITLAASLYGQFAMVFGPSRVGLYAVYLGAAIAGAILGAAIGIAQVLVLSRATFSTRYWVWANILAYAITSVLFLPQTHLSIILGGLSLFLQSLLGDGLNGIIPGLLTGIALKRGGRDTILWAVAQVLAAELGGVVARFLPAVLPTQPVILAFVAGHALLMFLFGLLVGIATGVLLIHWSRSEDAREVAA